MKTKEEIQKEVQRDFKKLYSHWTKIEEEDEVNYRLNNVMRPNETN